MSPYVEEQMIEDALAGKPVIGETVLGGIRQVPLAREADGKLYVLLKMADDGRPLWYQVGEEKDEEALSKLHMSIYNSLEQKGDLDEPEAPAPEGWARI